MQVVISGYGKMGHMIEGILLNKRMEVALASEDVCSVDPEIAKESVCIDFTTPEAFKANYKFIAEHFKAAVIGTTGWDDIRDEVIAAFEMAGTPMIYSANFSIGVNAVFAAVEKACEILNCHGYIPHIEEIHHIHKKDAPSGTAKTLASIVEKGIGIRPDITSFREGEVPGTHIVKFKSEVDKIKISHKAYSRVGFAEGAVYAATLTEGLSGVHEFKDLILK
ncbi:MAG: dihydrodipicolinate reductase C-terminal domain-containing protein [Candidatus Cryptobacteroides sp.]|nr:dihydrodipicolinate reductase C-terminal domain-containing protein [Candidatus Cryptobacteroides sp.]